MARQSYTTTPDGIDSSNPLNADWLFGLAVLLLLPALLFSSFVPGWAPPVAVVGLGAIFLLRLIATGQPISQTPADWPLLMLLFLLPLNLWISQDPAVTLPRIYAFVANLALFWAVAAQRDTPWLHWSGWVLLGAGLILSGILLVGTTHISSKLPFVDQNIYQALPRNWRPFWNPVGFNPNLSGGLLALFWPPAVILIWYGHNWQQRDIAKLVTVVLGIALVLTQSRGALLGVGVAFLFITLLLSRHWLWFWFVVLLLIGWGIYYAGPDIILDPLVGSANILEDSSLQSRQMLRQQALGLISAAPLTGVGLGLPGQVLHLDPVDVKHLHNLYLQIGAELGLPGLLAHLALYAILFYLLLQRARDPQAGYYRALALGLLGTLIVFLTHGFFEVITYAPRAAIIVWGLFGLMIAVATRPTEGS